MTSNNTNRKTISSILSPQEKLVNLLSIYHQQVLECNPKIPSTNNIIGRGVNDNKKAKQTTSTPSSSQMMDISYTVKFARNRRDYMEDRFVAKKNMHLTQFDEPNRFACYIVADGHGGKLAACFVTTYFISRLQIIAQLYVNSLPKNLKKLSVPIHYPLSILLKDTLASLMNDWDKKGIPGVETDDSGTTVTAILIDKVLLIASTLNLGDSRTVIFDSKTIKILLQTKDHALDTVEAQNAVRKLTNIHSGRKCQITKDRGSETYRVNGNLNMSHSFGDNSSDLLGCIVKKPDTINFMFEKNRKYTILIASDGYWDDINLEKTISLLKKNPQSTANELVTTLLQIEHHECSYDNVTLIVVNI